jgi:valine--pyruvate aminotransferase
MGNIPFAYSTFGHKFTAGSGILQLMEDLGDALGGSGGREMLMLGGGNPAHIPEMEALFRQRMETILATPNDFERIVGDYDCPQGEQRFLSGLASLLRREYGWPITAANLALTNGSQTAFFFLFNLFAGVTDNGKPKKILFPIAPEYIGYADLGLSDDFYVAVQPRVETIDEHTFKYRIDFDALHIGEDIGAVCVSRPTNPTGNVLTDDEIRRLGELAAAAGVPLIVDNAYGTPFPHIIFTEARPDWNEQTVLCMSLSKLGLPGTRTGIVVASEKIIADMAALNAIFSLAPGSLGVALALDLVESGDILRVSRDVVRPFYQAKMERAVAAVHASLAGADYALHKPEGALFLWLWCKDLRITTDELYERLKARGVLVVPGQYFFPGLAGDWPHQHQCLRITYAQKDDIVSRGIAIIGEEVRRARR